MKKLILILGGILLGIFIYNLILGNDPSSIKSSSKGVMERQIQVMKITP